jgi:mono/diheme cytochrome c family protein
MITSRVSRWSRNLLLLPLLSSGILASGAAWSQDTLASTEPTTVVVSSPDSLLTPEHIIAGRAAWKDSDCSSCHGWSGNGKDTGPVPPGPSLRLTQLDYDTIHTVIQCGLPGTRMAFHDRQAYVDDRCYGMKSADMGDTKPPKGMSMKAKEIDAVAAYVVGYLQNRGDTTKAECVEYFGRETAACASYP